MAGILHDIGKLIFAVQAEASYQRVLDLQKGSAISSLTAERTMFEFTHPEVGQMVAERWDLPARYVAAIAHHHAPADAAARAALRGSDMPASDNGERSALLSALELTPAHWEDCLHHLHDAQATFEGFVGAIH